MQKRNKAPLYANIDQLISEVQAKIEDIESKQKGLDRMSIVKGIDKYDDAFKGSASNSHNTSMNK